MKHIKNKRFLLSGSALLVAIVALGATIAYSHDSAVIGNDFFIGDMGVTASDTFVSPANWQPCERANKKVSFKNDGDVPVRVRVKINEYWRDAADARYLPLEKDGVRLANWTTGVSWRRGRLVDSSFTDGYYYFSETLAPGQSTWPLFSNDKITLSCDANFGADNVCTNTGSGTVCSKPDDVYEGAKYHINITAEFIQADAADTAWTPVLLADGDDVNAALKRLAGNSAATSESADDVVKSISVVDRLPDNIDTENGPKVNVGNTESAPIYAYIDDNNNIFIHADGKTLVTNFGSDSMFYNFRAVTSLVLTDRFYTGNTDRMYDMFSNMSSLTSLSLPESFDTQNVTNMSSMFANMESLVALTLPESFNTSKVKYMDGMFGDARRLTSLTLPSAFNTSSAQHMQDMFRGMEAITSIDLPPGFTAKSATNVAHMFDRMRNLKTLTLPEGFTAPVATNMMAMFCDLTELTTLTLPDSFDTSSATDMSHMFQRAYRLKSLTLPKSFNTANVTDMREMFFGLFRNSSENFPVLTLPSSFVINAGANTNSIFDYISSRSVLDYGADASVKAIWPAGIYRP